MRRKKMNTKHLISKGFAATSSLILIIISTLMLGATGCSPEPSPQPDTPHNPFTVVWGQGKDHVVTFTGNSIGHEAGKLSEFTLKLDNNSSSTWHGRYIVQLLDTEKIVMDIADDTFSVTAGIEKEIVITAEFTGNLDGPYGLSLYIPDREAQSIQTIWIGEKIGVAAGNWPSRATHPWLWPEISEFTEEEAKELVEQFVKTSPTFVFDGIEDSLEITKIAAFTRKETSEDSSDSGKIKGWEFVFEFESRHAGYGDRTGEMLAQVITPHTAVITVEQDEITSAIVDSKWDMKKQELVSD
jgi:hypothetical protein